MEVVDLPLKGLKLITPRIWRDERGFFFETYRSSLYANSGIASQFVQDNLSCSHKNTLRGLHYQSFPGQDKLVTCLSGTVWDVAVDLRRESATFGKWYAVELDDQKLQQLFIPVGFAHGFCVLSDTAIVQYKVSAVYDPATERSVRWNDPAIAIEWPIGAPVLSLRDQNSPFFEEVLV